MKKWIGAVLLAMTMLIAACGDDGDGTTDAGAAGDTAPADGSDGEGSDGADAAGPIVVEHRFGTTEITATPERIVSYDSQWTDVLASLDAPVVGALFNPYGERSPWQDGILPDAQELTYTQGSIPHEAIAALRPDLIVVSWEIEDQAAYDLLSAIAPTIPQISQDGVDPWQTMAEVAGQVLGAEDAAAALVADAEQTSADVLADLPGLDGKTYVLANYVPGDSIWVVADPEDGAGIFFSQIGMQIAPHILELPGLQQGRVQISLEQIELLDADLLILLTNDADPEEIPGYSSLGVVEAGAVSVQTVAEVTALNTPTPLSIPFALDLIRPVLEVTAG